MTTYKCESCGDKMQPGRAALNHPDVLKNWTCLICDGNMAEVNVENE